ncbi:sensor histidine kinase [Enterococcus diestrammenae]|uniref:Two-component system, sensor histidine kinase YesM n=1 Tax=Enterococcus diestrammenae TaxID=1155073 RepID=A0ABV0EXM8_9ENTE|nr:histidine kinase [Enterococcus diestrammenae]KAF1295891.1 hypothetical protein BAU18_07960 [Enterococcus diestrammenae]
MTKIKKLFQVTSIRQRLLVIFFLIVIPLILVGMYFTWSIRQDIIESKQRDTQVEMQRMRQDLEDTLNTVVHISNQIYQASQLSQVVLTQYETPSQLIEAYANFQVFDQSLRYYDDISNIRFLVKNPTMLTNSNFLNVTTEISQKQWYQNALANYGRISWQVIADPVTGAKNLALIRSVQDTEGRTLGVLCLLVNDPLIESIVSGSAIESYLVFKEDNTILAKKETISNSLIYQLQQVKLIEDSSDKTKANYQSDSGLQLTNTTLTIDQSFINHFSLNVLIDQQQLLAEVNVTMFRSYALIVGVFIAVLAMIIVFTNHFNARFLTLKRSMQAVAKGDFNISPTISGNDEITEIYATLYQTMESLQRLIVERYEHSLQEKNWQIMQKQSEFKLLASQINPHFLYNTLEMIRMKAVINKDPEVAESVKLLSKLLRRSLETNLSQTITLEAELDLVRMYMNIQQIRFADRLQYQLVSTVEEENLRVIPLIIQPIVENAFAHGVEKRIAEALISIQIFSTPKGLLIRVVDNGLGMDEATLARVRQELHTPPVEGRHIGLYNVDQRIKSFYGAEYGLTIDSVIGEGTIVDILIKEEGLD